jgi:hypothetical protein
MMYGYARVSTDGQSIAAQDAALTAAGAVKVFREVASGAKTDRARLCQALAALDAGDVLMVTRLDRLARSTGNLLNTLAAITGKGAGFRSLGDTWADTTTPHGCLMLRYYEGRGDLSTSGSQPQPSGATGIVAQPRVTGAPTDPIGDCPLLPRSSRRYAVGMWRRSASTAIFQW